MSDRVSLTSNTITLGRGCTWAPPGYRRTVTGSGHACGAPGTRPATPETTGRQTRLDEIRQPGVPYLGEPVG
jgi:hypothetical protein